MAYSVRSRPEPASLAVSVTVALPTYAQLLLSWPLMAALTVGGVVSFARDDHGERDRTRGRRVAGLVGRAVADRVRSRLVDGDRRGVGRVRCAVQRVLDGGHAGAGIGGGDGDRRRADVGAVVVAVAGHGRVRRRRGVVRVRRVDDGELHAARRRGVAGLVGGPERDGVRTGRGDGDRCRVRGVGAAVDRVLHGVHTGLRVGRGDGDRGAAHVRALLVLVAVDRGGHGRRGDVPGGSSATVNCTVVGVEVFPASSVARALTVCTPRWLTTTGTV